MRTINGLLCLAALFGLTLQACNQQAAKGDRGKSVVGTWIVTSVNGNEITSPEEEPIITIDENGVAQGTLGCNSMHSDVIIDAEGEGTLRFGDVGTTKKLCRNMKTEEAVVSLLEKVRKYSITGKGKDDTSSAGMVMVELQDEKGNVLMEALKLGHNTTVEAMTLLRGEWVIYSVGEDTLISEVTLPFIVDPASESVNGHTGCNSFGGTIVFKGAHGVSFPAIAMTQALGDDEQNEREGELMDALNNTSAWKEDSSGRVHFTDSLGHTLFVIER